MIQTLFESTCTNELCTIRSGKCIKKVNRVDFVFDLVQNKHKEEKHKHACMSSHIQKVVSACLWCIQSFSWKCWSSLIKGNPWAQQSHTKQHIYTPTSLISNWKGSGLSPEWPPLSQKLQEGCAKTNGLSQRELIHQSNSTLLHYPGRYELRVGLDQKQNTQAISTKARLSTE